MGDRRSAEFGEQTVLGPLSRVAGRGGGVVCREFIVFGNHIYHIRLRVEAEVQPGIFINQKVEVSVRCRALTFFLYTAQEAPH